MTVQIKVEDKLYQNRYRVDEGRPHIAIKDAAKCQSCTDKACTTACPAACYAAEDGGVTATFDGCLECGTCRVICQENSNIDWFYPRGGYGILYKFG
ncbi:ferredoxin family protein [Insolitispirillum peregrinum]|uniref:Ferredoxin-like protein n=1 Tax=Insolitispirillum peregrinum TaxID=80876 RepID=A0A1N7IP45_9PROT|nr:ferredoxin family protein [Insolitispirillum peregrinum]SIS38849.1 ferredoxin like protein [Insolitispirillum peregrinum]